MAAEVTLSQALSRAELVWDENVSHVDAEQAYLDRTILAAEVRSLRAEVTELEQAMAESEREILSLEHEVAELGRPEM